ncbi:hypothetical protein [Acrocarpospora pleiomorpha]|nr:hypothetical protein [Acrocarpospora pleiomorpha]
MIRDLIEFVGRLCATGGDTAEVGPSLRADLAVEMHAEIGSRSAT